MKNVYICYDTEKDHDLMILFKEHIEEHDYQYNVIGSSFNDETNNTSNLHKYIEDSDLFLVLCGYRTDRSSNVNDEFEFAMTLQKKYLFIKGRKDSYVTMPKKAGNRDVMYVWNHINLKLLYKKLFEGEPNVE